MSQNKKQFRAESGLDKPNFGTYISGDHFDSNKKLYQGQSFEANPEKNMFEANDMSQNNAKQVKRFRKNQSQRVYTTESNYRDIPSIENEFSKNKRKELKKSNDDSSRLPVIKSIKYVVHDQAHPRINLVNSLNYMTPTVNSVLLKKKRKGKEKYQSKKICSVKCIQNKKEPPIEIKQINFEYLPKKKQTFVPSLREYLYEPSKKDEYIQYQNKLSTKKYKDDANYFTKKYDSYLVVQPKIVSFTKIETQYAKEIFNPKPLINQYQEVVANRQLIPSIPRRNDITQFIEQYIPRSQEIDKQKLFASSRFLVEYTPDEMYFGQMDDNLRSGKGILISKSKCFEGYFNDNQKIKGVEFSTSGIYRGQYNNDKRQGTGQFQWYNGQFYMGEWKNGKRHGNGVWKNKFGDSFNGQWKNGKGQGYGEYVVRNQKYKGQFVNFKKEGWGKQKFSNGDKFEGSFQNGYPHGKGIYYWNSGAYYQGEFKYGLRSGKGALEFAEGLKYHGQFIEQRPSGLCEITYTDGSVYKGYCRDGKRDGRGVLKVKSQSSLDGYWENDNFINSFLY